MMLDWSGVDQLGIRASHGVLFIGIGLVEENPEHRVVRFPPSHHNHSETYLGYS
jgi:hypothetical protein